MVEVFGTSPSHQDLMLKLVQTIRNMLKLLNLLCPFIHLTKTFNCLKVSHRWLWFYSNNFEEEDADSALQWNKLSIIFTHIQIFLLTMILMLLVRATFFLRTDSFGCWTNSCKSNLIRQFYFKASTMTYSLTCIVQPFKKNKSWVKKLR